MVVEGLHSISWSFGEWMDNVTFKSKCQVSKVVQRLLRKIKESCCSNLDVCGTMNVNYVRIY